MAFDAFIKLTDINGPVTRKGLEKYIEVLSFSHGVSVPHNASASGGHATGRPELSGISFMKRGDATSPALFGAVTGGKHFPQVIISFWKSGGKEQLKFMEYKMTECFLTNWQVSGSGGGDDTPMESCNIEFTSLEITFLPQDAKGAVGQPVVQSYDIRNAQVK